MPPPVIEFAETENRDTPSSNKDTHYTTSTHNESSRPLSACSTVQTSPVPALSSPRRKRKRTGISHDRSSWTPEPGTILPEASEKPLVPSAFEGIRPPPLVYPKSLYTGHEPPLPTTKETLVLQEILEAESIPSASDKDGFISIDLDNFSIYRPHQVLARRANKIGEARLAEKTRSGELVSLQELHDRGSTRFCFDGILRFGLDGQYKRYVQGIPFETLSIGAYEDVASPTVGSDIWLQSFSGKASKIWYRFQLPSTEYSRYHKPFIWLADLAKHVVDFMYTHHSKIRLHDFKGAFVSWLSRAHSSDDRFLSWRSVYPPTDFRQIVAAHATFLYNQAGQLGAHYISQPLWSEIDPVALTAIPRQISQRKECGTVVTSFVYECFSHLPWAKFLNPVTAQATGSLQQRRGSPHARITFSEGPIQTGDIVAIPSDTNTHWKTKDKHWYAYVQEVTGQQLGLIWLYRPTDTACQNMKYPYPRELFMSNHCNCGDTAIYASEAARKIRVELFGDPDPEPTQAEFVIRQKYNSEDSFWTTLQTSDFRCQCGKDQVVPQYNVGDTVLVKAVSPKETLEPVVLLQRPLLEHSPDQANQLRVRRLLRKREDYGDKSAEANELVYTAREDLCEVSSIARQCYVRFYNDRECIPAPYNRSGTGDCFYILQEESASGELQLLQQPWPVMKQGFDPLVAPAQRPMRGLDIFCGGGSLGRGLEESQAVKNEWAVDYFTEAIHTYHANIQQSAQLYNGSVNDYLFQAITGRGSGKIAQQGEVEFIAAGSPCQGFSIANHRYSSDQSLLNISMVASVVAFVDFYRPKYVIMENVLGMVNCGPKRAGQDNNVFAQVLCALVGLGYQVRPMILDAWSLGAPQGRTRLFISAAAPGLAPLAKPPPSHSHPDTVIGRSLGKTANGLPFGSREWEPTPFEYVSIGEATKDLPENVDARTACIPYPDHRVTGYLNALDSVRLTCVPRFPPGMTFVKSAKLGWQPRPQMAAWHWDTEIRSSINSMAYQRAKSNALLPTLTTVNSPSEALTGSALHWDAHRCLTVMEARRAQGYPDDEVIVGNPSMQWKILGNSVARQVATALGICLRKAWLANEMKDKAPPEAKTEVESPRGEFGTAGVSHPTTDGLKVLPVFASTGIRLQQQITVSLPAIHEEARRATIQVDATFPTVMEDLQPIP